MESRTIDAEKMESYISPDFTADDLLHLPDFHVAARLLCNNTPARTVVFPTIPPVHPNNTASADNVVGISKMKYSVPVESVERDIARRRKFYTNIIEDIDE